VSRSVIVDEADEFPPGTHKVVEIEGRQIGIFNIDGSLYGLPNICPHQIGPLCEGRVSGTLVASKETEWRRQWAYEGEIITCPWHGLEFHVPTGQCLAYKHIKLRRYAVDIVNGKVRLTFST